MNDQQVFEDVMTRPPGAMAEVSDEELLTAALHAARSGDAHAGLMLGVEIGLREAKRPAEGSLLVRLISRYAV